MSQHFSYQGGELFAEQLALAQIAEHFGTPCYVYSRQAIEESWRAFEEAFASQDHLICYAVKANSNIAVLNLLASLGSGFDIVSVGELERVLKAGGDPARIVFSGVGKTEVEMQRALKVGVKCFNVESVSELARLNNVAASLACIAPVSLRVNPDVDAKTHPYISTGLKENKFGIAYEQARETYAQGRDMNNIELVGIDCHIGSQIIETSPFVDALERLMVLVKELEADGILLQHIDIGGGLGIRYDDEDLASVTEYADAVMSVLGNSSYEIIAEPGRNIIGNAGVLLTRVEYLKPTAAHNFAIVDAAMNDLLRPSLYSAFHEILPLKETGETPALDFDIVGPICESSDFLGKSRRLSIQEGDLLAVCSAGAYGFSMSSNYNSRPRVTEIMVAGEQMFEIRRRESIEDLYSHESILP